MSKRKSINVQKRRQAREYMLTVLFQMEGKKDFSPDEREKAFYLNDDNIKFDSDYCGEVFEKFTENINHIDDILNTFSKGWSTKRMAKADLAVLRLALTEILFMETIPTAVTADEAVELAKKFGTDKSSSFVNAVLGQVIQQNKEECPPIF